MEEEDCDVEFAEEFIFTIVTSFIEFCVPFALVVLFNGLLYWNIKKRSKKVHPTSSQTNNLKRDRKAAWNLAILVICFFFCWSPYTISTIIVAFCPGCVNVDMYEFFNWLLWINSSLNPFLYAYSNPRIRRHFQRMLCQCLPKKSISHLEDTGQNSTQRTGNSTQRPVTST